MENPALPQQLKALVLCGLGLMLAVVLGSQIGGSNYRPIFLGALIVVVAGVALFSGRFFWVLTIASSFMGGTFPILGAAFTPFQMLMAIGVAKFLIGDVVLRRTRIKIASRFDAMMIAGFMGVLTWHAIHDRFGMRFLGSSVWGGHNYVNVYVGLAAFFVVQSLPMTTKIWAKLPYVVLALTAFDLLIAIITTISPRSIYVIYPFYSAVSSTSLEEVVTGTTADLTGRIGAFGNFGFTFIALILSSASLRQMLHPANFFKLVGMTTGFIAVLSTVLNTLFLMVAAGIRDLKKGVFFLLPIFAFVLFALSAVNSQFIHLPKQIQRGLAFFPGAWDADMARDAAASNDFRRRIWTLWANAYFPAQPWLGRGFGFRSEWSQRSIYTYRGATDYPQMVETGNLHNGLFAALDTFGIVGTIFFVAWNVRLLIQTFRVRLRKNDPGGAALRFLALYLAVLITSYWIGSSSVGSFLPLEFALAGVFLRLQSSVNPDAVRDRDTASPSPTLREAPISA